MRLFVVRHTSVSVAPGLCYGRSEVPLSAGFEEEARGLAERFGNSRYLVFTSPSGRCRRLAEKLSSSPIVDERLRELDFGNWENRLWSDLPDESVRRWCDDFVESRVPGGESFEELARRADAFSTEIAARKDEGLAVAVTHAGVVRALLAKARGLPLSEAFSISVPFGEAFEVNVFCPPSPTPGRSPETRRGDGRSKTDTAHA